MRTLLRLCVAIATVAIAGPISARAETRALLVGATDYVSPLIPDLKGPKNDLIAMEALMRGQGATDILVLRDADATRTAIESAIHQLGARAAPGDWVVIYFSGHGAQAEAATKGDEDDDLDEFLVLSGFDMNAPDPETYITDNDFHAWLARYMSAEVQILHIADACHSGTLNRSIDPRAWAFTPRLAAYRGDAPLQLARPAPRFAGALVDSVSAGGESADLPNVVFIGAAQDDQLALEASLPVEGAPARGLLTFALEQALTSYGADGKTLAADTDRDGRVSIGELGLYLDSQTRQLTGQRQQSSTRFVAGREGDPLFTKAPPPAPAPREPPRPAVFTADSQAARLLAADPAWRLAPSAAEADFVWDPVAGVVLRRSGDTVARGVRALPGLAGVLDKWRVVEQLRPLLSEGLARVVIGPRSDGARYELGARAQVSVHRQGGVAAAAGFLTVFNLASDGVVQALYPTLEDGDGLLPADGDLPLFDTTVVEPFGADHVIAVVTPHRPKALRALLTSVDGTRAASRVAAAVRADLILGGGGAALSIGELYTGPESGLTTLAARP